MPAAKPQAGPADDLLRKVQAELDLLRPAIREDGGDVELLGVEQGAVRIRFRGACVGCPSSAMTLRHGIERHLTSRVAGVREVLAVED